MAKNLTRPRDRWARWTALATLGLACASCFSQAQTIEGEPDAHLAARVLGVEVHASDPEEVRYWILRKLTDRYAAEKGIEVTQGEIDAYLDGMARIAAEDRRQREARREEIEGRLATPGLGDADRKAVSSELDSLDQLQQSLDDLSSGDSEDAEKTRQTRRTIAAAFIRQWKLNQALYQQYGGRIIVQQGGPEPLDAYRTFLGDEQRHGAFEFLDRSLEAAFWRYYLTDSMHSFYPPGSMEERQAFQTPWWQ